jgi:hypothetical protein
MPINQPSEKQSAASRANGAKSKGPVSPEGRARSAQNSLRHGLSSAVVVLPHEDRAQFEQLRDTYMDDFQPANQSQHDLVETMAAARWRLNRLQEVEAKLFEKEMVLRDDDMEKELSNMNEVEKLAWVFDHLANHSKSLAMLIRHEGNLNGTYGRAFKQLQELQSQPARPSPRAAEKIQNEPEPAPAAPPKSPQTAPETRPSTHPTPALAEIPSPTPTPEAPDAID